MGCEGEDSISLWSCARSKDDTDNLKRLGIRAVVMPRLKSAFIQYLCNHHNDCILFVLLLFAYELLCTGSEIRFKLDMHIGVK